MEPRADDGDDRIGGLVVAALVDAAMEPRADDGDDMAEKGYASAQMVPQWSPVLMTGTTSRDRDRHGRERAAMEPRADDGDDDESAPSDTSATSAAMEPRADDGDDEPCGATCAHVSDAAMEPRADDGDDVYHRPPAAASSSSRNGAPC